MARRQAMMKNEGTKDSPSTPHAILTCCDNALRLPLAYMAHMMRYRRSPWWRWRCAFPFLLPYEVCVGGYVSGLWQVPRHHRLRKGNAQYFFPPFFPACSPWGVSLMHGNLFSRQKKRKRERRWVPSFKTPRVHTPLYIFCMEEYPPKIAMAKSLLEKWNCFKIALDVAQKLFCPNLQNKFS